jgi:RNA-binding protein
MMGIKSSSNLQPHVIREMKGKLHQLKPMVVIDNNGLTDELFKEIDQALNDNELIKIRTLANSSEELSAIAEKVCVKAKAVLIQTIGQIIAVYRKNLQVEE